MNRKLKALRSLFVPSPGSTVITAVFAAVTLVKASISYWYEVPTPLSTGLYFLTMLLFGALLLLSGWALCSFFRILKKRKQLEAVENMRWELLADLPGGGLGTADENSTVILSLDLEIAGLRREITALQ